MNKQDNYALVHKNATIERKEIWPWKLPRVLSWDCPNHPNGICTFSFFESPIICCENFAVFAAYRFHPRVQHRSAGGLCILRFRCIFLSVCILSDFLRNSNNCGYFLPSAFAFTTPIVYPPSRRSTLSHSTLHVSFRLLHCLRGPSRVTLTARLCHIDDFVNFHIN